MNFTTKVPIPQYQHSIDYNSKILSLGSCFATNMADKLEDFKFENSCNPFGIIFNPVSIERLIYRIINQSFYTEIDVFFHNERWHCFEIHSDLSHSNKEQFLENLNELLKTSLAYFLQSSHIIITYGTSWVYRNKATNAIVANCHKVSQKEFSKGILSVETIEKSIQNSLDLIRKINPDVNFIFTVSPVRHLKDGFVENQLSKAHLISALNQVLKVLPSGAEGVYFPSYEIMMDELRDYRFYAEDMIHPSQTAIDYIWQRFSDTAISEESQMVMKEVETIQKGLQHRPFNPNSESHQLFLSKLQDKIEKLQKQFPQIQF